VDARQIHLVRSSFALVQPMAGEAAALFYANLFDADPSLRPLFRGDMVMQGQRLMQMIGVAVNQLGQPPALLQSALRQMGARHAGYGVQASHYGTVGAALLKTLQQGLGDAAFTPEVRDAWAALYGLVSRCMQEGAMEAAAVC
jgi:hemoglobin-like flavoprotein